MLWVEDWDKQQHLVFWTLSSVLKSSWWEADNQLLSPCSLRQIPLPNYLPAHLLSNVLTFKWECSIYSLSEGCCLSYSKYCVIYSLFLPIAMWRSLHYNVKKLVYDVLNGWLMWLWTETDGWTCLVEGAKHILQGHNQWTSKWAEFWKNVSPRLGRR